MIEYSDISTDGRDEVRLHQSDVTGVGEVEEWLEADHEVCRQPVVFLQSHSGLSAVRNEIVVLLHVCHHREHLLLAVTNDPLLTKNDHVLVLTRTVRSVYHLFWSDQRKKSTGTPREVRKEHNFQGEL